MAVQLTEEDVEVVDEWMNDHMYGHQISNNVNGMSCDSRCRMQALMLGINRVLKEKTEKKHEGCCMHGHTRAEHPVCFDSEGRAV